MTTQDRERMLAVALGVRLRAARRRKGLTLDDVAAQSNFEFRAPVLSAYERGDRNISLARLATLAEFYGCAVAELLLPALVDAGFHPTIEPDSWAREIVAGVRALADQAGRLADMAAGGEPVGASGNVMTIEEALKRRAPSTELVDS
jgi:transcriptional regulator with XRE-family HTH domain